MKIAFIRHGKTQGNLEKRYIGRTDEVLCKAGMQELLEKKTAGYYPNAAMVYVSPMKRCLETAELLYPGKPQKVVEDLREMDFGIFEGKNYLELSGNPAYQEWLDSQCEDQIPGGESRAEFEKRCVRGFGRVLSEICGIRAEDSAQVWKNEEGAVQLPILEILECAGNLTALEKAERIEEASEAEVADCKGNLMLPGSNGVSCAFVVHGGTIMSILHAFAKPPADYYAYQCGNGEKIVCEVKGEIR